MAEATLTVEEILSQQRTLVDERLIDAALTVPVESDVTAMTAPPQFHSHPPISQPVCLRSIRPVRSYWMTDAEIKDRIRQLLLNGFRLLEAAFKNAGSGGFTLDPRLEVLRPIFIAISDCSTLAFGLKPNRSIQC